MLKRKSSLRKLLVTNLALAAIIVFVYLSAFSAYPALFMRGPVMKGNTNGDNVALQIAADDNSDVALYMDALDRFGVKATFFFSEQQYSQNSDVLRQVLGRGNGIGYYPCKEGGQRLMLYIGGGYNIPVMSYLSDSRVLQVCPSIDVEKLQKKDDWQQVFSESLLGDMFIYTSADNNLADFEKVVQIVLNKGYTILKMDEML
ncbi:MAG: hypothetical protein ACM3S4_07960 [Burkholderiales bacterium]